ncbi:MAG: C-GCAxxG-C-C family protein, partial [Bacteroidales bacterium]
MNNTIDIDERVQRAVSYFKSGYNCSQSVFMAYADIFELDEKFAARISAPLGGGMGRLREVCGAVSGSFLLAGLKYPADDPLDRAAKTKNYAVVQELASKFREKNGSIICRDLLGLQGEVKESHIPAERTTDYYKRRPCAEYVA